MVVGGLSATVREGRRGKGEKAGARTHMHMHTHSHTNTSHTFRRGRCGADMKSCHLKKKRGGRERRGREGGVKKKSAALSSPSCAF